MPAKSFPQPLNMEEMNWVVQINEELKSINNDPCASEMKQWNKHSIYKIPACIADMNKKAYIPQTASFGPYHFGQKHLMPLEEHKHRALLHFLKRCGKPLEDLVHCMGEVVQDLKDSYKPLDPIWKEDTQRFLQLMIFDGCFMLEILRTSDCIPGDYPENDYIFSDHGRLHTLSYIKRDMLMLENQLPMLVLDILLGFEGNKIIQDEEFLSKLVLKFFSPTTPLNKSMGKCLHVLDVFRKSLLQQGPSCPTRICKAPTIVGHGDHQIFRSATELHEAGIRIRRSKTQSLRDVSFDDGVLRLPTMVVDDTSEAMFLNLIAFERLHIGAGNEVSSYLFFMDTIIDHETDVAPLNKRGILINALGSDKAVAKLFNSLSKDVTVDPNSPLDVVRVSLSNYCKLPWNRWRANLIHTYFRNPWAIVSLVAAIFLFAFTIVQTFYTIQQYYQPDSCSTVTPRTPRPPLP